jgi:MoaA/NifB/PqqE/SkfB family radical SAM enzyme
MIQYEDIRDVHLEISSLCNASCPWCPRTFWGYPHNGGYPEVNFTLDHAKKVFQSDFLKQLTSVYINGNFGDIVMNPEGPDIVDYFLEQNPSLSIRISTNGGARDQKFWTQLGSSKVIIDFCLDGLADTHHLYRQNTSWDTVIKNAKAFIAAGGQAVWKMIRFNHNYHQINQCRQMSKELGFAEFVLITDGRDTAPVFNKQGELTHVLGNYIGETDFKVLFHKKKTDQILLTDIVENRKPSPTINCKAKNKKSIYNSATGDVSPGCFLGFYPKTYGAGQYHEAANAQLVPLISKNNALKHPLAECITWFNEIEKSWNISEFDKGRLVICDDVCGQIQ